MSLASPCRPGTSSIKEYRRFIFETECTSCVALTADCCHITCLLPPVIEDNLLSISEKWGNSRECFHFIFAFSQEIISNKAFQEPSTIWILSYCKTKKNNSLCWQHPYSEQLPCNQIIRTDFYLKLLFIFIWFFFQKLNGRGQLCSCNPLLWTLLVSLENQKCFWLATRNTLLRKRVFLRFIFHTGQIQAAILTMFLFTERWIRSPRIQRSQRSQRPRGQAGKINWSSVCLGVFQFVHTSLDARRPSLGYACVPENHRAAPTSKHFYSRVLESQP